MMDRGDGAHGQLGHMGDRHMAITSLILHELHKKLQHIDTDVYYLLYMLAYQFFHDGFI